MALCQNCKTNPASTVHHITRLRDIVDGFEVAYCTALKAKYHPLRRRFYLSLPTQKRDFQQYHWNNLSTMFTCRSCNSSLG